MDAVDFLKGKDEVCTSYDHCYLCPLGEVKNGHHTKCEALMSLYPDEAVYIVEQWIEEHPDDNTLLAMLQKRFEQEEHEAYKKDAVGSKEHVVWNKAIRILEEYMHNE